MKYFKQLCIITGVSFIGELLNAALPLPIPASVYGLVIMTALLIGGVVKLEMIEETADFLISVMALFFVPSSVGLMTSLDVLGGNLIQIFGISFLSAFVTMAVTGRAAQWIIRLTHKEER